jgi:hypothetical protein
MSDIAVDKEAFHDRLSAFISAWKNDKRASDAVFGGVGSMVICVGKASEQGTSYQKSAAFQVTNCQLAEPAPPANDGCLALDSRIRVPRHFDCPYARRHHFRHNQEEGYVCSGACCV